MLFLVATPIGHLADISFRAVSTLKAVGYILCEDTRRSRILLDHYQIQTPLKSFHSFNERSLEESVIQDLQCGLSIALISDAGTPAIADPGYRLIQRCRELSVPFTAIPGPSAVINALSLSGFATHPFQFIGFLSQKKKERQEILIQALYFKGITICFEGPSRIKETLEELSKLGPTHRLCLVREMTKIHEEVVRGTASDLLSCNMRGEMVLLIEGKKELISKNKETIVQELQETFALSKIEAIKLAVSLYGFSRKELYF